MSDTPNQDVSDDIREDAMSQAAPAKNIENVRVEDEMEQSYIDYAMSVIAGRALPDVRDGLKPVQRRILYAMHESGVTSNVSHRKSSNVVGDTMGDYHPHGDSAIYDTLARMTQDFSLRYPLIDGQGNFGSVDDDPPAAMRYTEARMAPISETLLEDIDKDTVAFQSNYDDRTQEPEVMPASFPNLLVNGASGIAVGMSTRIPPHNLTEVIDATIHLIDNPDAEVADLMNHVSGPDFPTGAKIVGREGIRNAYETGRGRIKMRADFEIVDDDKIVVHEIPFQTNKARLVERIAQSVEEGRIEGISALRDESDRDGIRIVTELKRGAVPEVVKNKLLEHHLEKSFSVINLALVDGQPQVLTLKETLQEYVDHRRSVIRRRSQNELDEAEENAHRQEGRITALDNAQDVVDIIQNAEDNTSAKEALIQEYEFSEEQVTHVIRMRLSSLTSMEADKVREEYEETKERIERLEEILGDEQELMDVVKDELRDVRDEFGDERRTEIVEDVGSVSNEDLIPQEDIYVILSEEGYVKRLNQSAIDPQRRGGKGLIGTSLKDGDAVHQVLHMNTHDHLLLFTDTGDVHRLKGYEIPEQSRRSRGQPLAQHLDLSGDEDVAVMASVPDLDEEASLVLVSANGYIKQTELSEFQNIHTGGIRAVSLDEDDSLVDVHCVEQPESVMITTRNGRAIRFSPDEVRPMGRSAQGVRAIELQGDDSVVGLAPVHDEQAETLLTVTENGYGKRTAVSDYREQSRYGKGLLDIDTGSRNGLSVAAHITEDEDDVVIMTEQGQLLRTHAEDISVVGRNAKGVRLTELDDSDAVVSVTRVPPADEEENEVEDNEEE